MWPPFHPAGFGQPQTEETNAGVFVFEAARQMQPHGLRAGLPLWEGCSPGAASSHMSSVASHRGAPGDLPLSPAAVPLPSAAPVSCPSPNSPLVSPPPDICVGGPHAWDARLPCPSWWLASEALLTAVL